MALIQTPSFVRSTPPRPHSPRVPRSFVGRVVAEPKRKLASIFKLFLLEWLQKVSFDILIVA